MRHVRSLCEALSVSGPTGSGKIFGGEETFWAGEDMGMEDSEGPEGALHEGLGWVVSGKGGQGIQSEGEGTWEGTCESGTRCICLCHLRAHAVHVSSTDHACCLPDHLCSMYIYIYIYTCMVQVSALYQLGAVRSLDPRTHYPFLPPLLQKNPAVFPSFPRPPKPATHPASALARAVGTTQAAAQHPHSSFLRLPASQRAHSPSPA